MRTLRTLFPALLLLTTVCLLTSCSKKSLQPMTHPIASSVQQPPFLQPGDRVALISPAYFTPMDNVLRTADLLRSWNLEPLIGPNVGKSFAGEYAGTVAERLADIRWALADSSIKAVICNRGGYGTIHLIDSLPPSLWASHPKWLVGFSDITTLHGLLSNARVPSLHATMSSFLALGGNDSSSLLLRDLLFGSLPIYQLPPHPLNVTGKASGILVGGNLSTLSANLHTPADPTASDSLVLFIEDVEETMHNIDRQFTLLLRAGVLDRCSAVILGQFTDCNDEFSFPSPEAMLLQYLQAYNIPVLCDFPAGHGSPNLPLLLGSPVSLEVRPDGSSLQFLLPSPDTRTVVVPDSPQLPISQ